MPASETGPLALALGNAALEIWPDLPQDIQRQLFEAAAGQANRSGDREFREHLAKFLHDRHPRTAD